MEYSIRNDFISHGYNNKIANKVDFLLNGLINIPGIFNFDNNSIKIYSDGFNHLEGKIEITNENDIVVDFYYDSSNNEKCHYQYKDGKIRYIVSQRYGLYIIKAKENDDNFTISYYDQKAKDYIKSKYKSDENGEDILLTKPKKVFKSEGISPDYSYSDKVEGMNISFYIFSGMCIGDCDRNMEAAFEAAFYDDSYSKTKKRKKN